jgi:tetratricopeptide (TPR) repeat protein
LRFPGTVLVLLAALAPARGAGLPPASPADAQAHYDRCLDDARASPQKGYDEAQAWRNAGGGFPADHCAAVALFALHRYTEAAQAFEALSGAMMADRASLRAGAMEQAGESWLLADEPKKALAAFGAALQFTPQDPNLYIARARADAEEKNWKTAIGDLDEALAIAPGKVDALVYRASAYRELGDLPHARTDIDAALREVPDDAAGLLERGNIRRLQDDLAGAREDWQRVDQLAPGSPAAAAAKGNLARLEAGGTGK